MQNSDYQIPASELATAIDLAIQSIEAFPPTGWNSSYIAQFKAAYLDTKQRALNPEPQFANNKSLKFLVEDVLTLFQESSGPAVERFWSEVKERGLSFKRKNRMAQILKRGKIKNKQEFNMVIDLITPYQQLGIVSNDEIVALKQMIGEFENR